MKRISIMVAVMSVALLSIVAFGAGGASASVLCKVKATTCPIASVYPPGAKMWFGAQNVTMLQSGITVFKCKYGGIEVVVTASGGASPNDAETEITNWTFEECTDSFGEAQYPEQVGNPFSVVSWNTGTYTGEFQTYGEQISVDASAWVGSPCLYKLVEQPTLKGPDEKSGYSQLVFAGELAEPVEPESPCHGLKMNYSGKYSQLYSSDPVYVTSG